jgi:hypothetical protein
MSALELPAEIFVLVLAIDKLKALVLMHLVGIKNDRHDRKLVVIPSKCTWLGLGVRD